MNTDDNVQELSNAAPFAPNDSAAEQASPISQYGLFELSQQQSTINTPSNARDTVQSDDHVETLQDTQQNPGMISRLSRFSIS